jgi:hypothetical protein
MHSLFFFGYIFFRRFQTSSDNSSYLLEFSKPKKKKQTNTHCHVSMSCSTSVFVWNTLVSMRACIYSLWRGSCSCFSPSSRHLFLQIQGESKWQNIWHGYFIKYQRFFFFFWRVICYIFRWPSTANLWFLPKLKILSQSITL